MNNKANIAKHSPTATSKFKPIIAKQVMILDTNDGAFTDSSVKVKPCKGDDRKLVLKCTDMKRLVETLKRLNLALAAKPTKGSKHFIAFVWKNEMGIALAAQQAMAGVLSGTSSKQIAGAK